MNGLLFNIGARVGAELHFGFIGVPELALQASIGVYLAYGQSSASIANNSITSNLTGFSTTVSGIPGPSSPTRSPRYITSENMSTRNRTRTLLTVLALATVAGACANAGPGYPPPVATGGTEQSPGSTYQPPGVGGQQPAAAGTQSPGGGYQRPAARTSLRGARPRLSLRERCSVFGVLVGDPASSAVAAPTVLRLRYVQLQR